MAGETSCGLFEPKPRFRERDRRGAGPVSFWLVQQASAVNAVLTKVLNRYPKARHRCAEMRSSPFDRLSPPFRQGQP
jgi:hypothetical protein